MGRVKLSDLLLRIFLMPLHPTWMKYFPGTSICHCHAWHTTSDPFSSCFSPQVIVLLAQSKAFQFVLGNRGNVSVMNAQKLNLQKYISAPAMFPIRPVALGEMEITVYAVSAETSDTLVWRFFVKVQFDANIQ